MYSQIAKKIEESNNIAILSHVMPDGDNIGSSLALYNALTDMNKKAAFILDGDVPYVYAFLRGSNLIRKPGIEDDFDLAVVLDCGDAERLGATISYINGKQVIIMDHHISNKGFGDINLIDVNASATGELVYNLLKELRFHISKSVAECLYTAIVTDTGMFQYSNTTDITHQIAAELIKSGVSPSEMFQRIYQSQPKSKVLLVKKALESLEFYENDSISCISLTQEQIDETGATASDTENIINYGRDIDKVEVAILLKELEKGKVKVSFRSKNRVDVCAVAMTFGGGGHTRASGCTINDSIENAKQLAVRAVINEMHGGE
ncbi:MAG: DHH family phosphoesterase [Bacillota bacterium]